MIPCVAVGGEAPLDQVKTTLFIPTLNEIDGVKAIMPQIKREWVDEIIFVDCKSIDGTPEWLQEHGYRVITQKSRGLALAYWECFDAMAGDRKSTRLNSSHLGISYAVFCLKKTIQ